MTALIHEKAQRGTTRTGWLTSRHTFSFGGFRDPNRVGHRALRVLNDDVVIPGAGFGQHPHRDMDIVTYVVSGSLRHQDSMGNTSVIRAGEFQHMYAGTGVVHSEMNASETEEVHFLQIWILPERVGGAPTYFQIDVDLDAHRNGLIPVAGPEPRAGQAGLRSDTRIFLARLDEGTVIRRVFGPGRAGFLHIVDGVVDIEGHRLSAGDGLQFEAKSACDITAKSDAEVMLFDLR
ncbi:MAG: pirin family protein [Thermoanaerobaculales bacterium]|jgi:redox-sensitive bicupin YhaK (pirin superfamily)|nr:pirin family protein [Thermoanaerobaculales bacterium]